MQVTTRIWLTNDRIHYTTFRAFMQHYGDKWWPKPLMGVNIVAHSVLPEPIRERDEVQGRRLPLRWRHNGRDGISITSLTIVYSTVYSGADQSRHQSSASLAFVWGIHRGPVNSPHKWPVTRKMFPFDDVIMTTDATIRKASWITDLPQRKVLWNHETAPALHVTSRTAS